MSRFFLSETDVQLLNRLLKANGLARLNMLKEKNDFVPCGPLVFKTPAGGIPGRTGSGFPFTPGKAECELCWIVETTSNNIEVLLSAPLIKYWVYNSETTAIGEYKIIQAKPVGRFYFVDVGECA
jgi:hypothetical protein